MKIDMDELLLAMDCGDLEERYHLDKQTGEVILLTGDTECDLDDFLESVGELTGSEEESARFEAWLAESGSPDWQQDELRLRYQMECDDTGRFVTIPAADSRESYHDMEAFIETVDDEKLQNRLWRAVGGRGAFRMLKDTLIDVHDERERWFEFKNDRLRTRALDWLESINIQLEEG